MEAIWNTTRVHEGTVFWGMNNSMIGFTENYKDKLPSVHDCKTLMCFSDYSGEEKESNYSLYSFLIIVGDNLQEWDDLRVNIRNKLLPDGRRISYKNYRDKLSQNFIKEYLKIANELYGYLITVSISKNLTSLFENDQPINLENPDFHKYSTWTKDTLEKTFRVIHLLGFFVAGFSREHQNLIWITDNDKIAANRERIMYLTELFSYTTTKYLNHTLGHLRIGTTQSDNGSRLIEDLCSIPDLAAGAYSDQLKITKSELTAEASKVFWLYAPDFKMKTNNLSMWLATSNNKLCKLFFKIDKSGENKSDISFYHFYNRE